MLSTFRLRMAAVTAVAALTLSACGAPAGGEQPTSPVGEGSAVSHDVLSTPAASGEAVTYVQPAKATTTKTTAAVAYRTTANVNLRTGASTTRAIVRKLPQGTTAITTGTKSGTWWQVKAGTSTGWVHSRYLAKVTTANPKAPAKPAPRPTPKTTVKTTSVWTTVPTGLYGDSAYGKKSLNLKAQTKLTKLGTSGTMTKVKYGSRTGWVSSEFLSAGQPGTTAKPYPKASTYAQHASNNIAKWCWGVPVTTRKGSGGTASFSTRSYGGDNMIVTEQIKLGIEDPVHSAQAKATQYHECAHILQYRAYKYDGPALEKAMDRIYPRGGANTFNDHSSYAEGTEHMADCMADVMGAQRTGRYTQGGITHTWWSGYGGNCTPAQLNHAKKLIAGQKV